MASEIERSNLRILFSSGWYWGVPLVALVAMAVLHASGENAKLFLLMNHAMTIAGDTFWSHVTILGDSVVAIMFITPFIYRRPDVVWQFILTVFFAGLVVYLLKDPDVLRPPAVLDPDDLHIIGPALRHVSFPSGHTTTAFLLAGLFCMQRVDSRVKSLVLFLAAMAGISRIACGIHWPLDVLGGAFFGWMAAGVGVGLGRRWQVGMNLWAQRFFAVLFNFVAIWSMLYYDNGYPGTWLMQSSITIICLALSLPWQLKLFKVRE